MLNTDSCVPDLKSFHEPPALLVSWERDEFLKEPFALLVPWEYKEFCTEPFTLLNPWGLYEKVRTEPFALLVPCTKEVPVDPFKLPAALLVPWLRL